MKRRQAFTLVELMVSMALIIFMMAILSQAFIAALGVFRNLKGQGDLAEKLRATMQILQRDLGANHFDSNRRLSDPTFWNNGPPQQGFFQVWHGSAPSQLINAPGTPPNPCYIEGFDLDGVGTYRTVNHSLAFMVRLNGNDMGDFLSAGPLGSGDVLLPTVPPVPAVIQLPNGIGSIQNFGPVESRYQTTSSGAANTFTYNYQWGEVAWFLQPQFNPTTAQQDTTVPDPSNGYQPIPLYTLYRRQKLLVPDNNLVAASTNPIGGVPTVEQPGNIPTLPYYQEMSCWANGAFLYFNNPTDITVPQRRFGYNIATVPPTYPPGPLSLPGLTSGFSPILPPTSSLFGSDIQLNDVISFDVRLMPMLPVGTVVPPTQTIDPFVTLFSQPFSTVAVPAGLTPSPFTYTAPTGVPGLVFDTWSSVNDGQPGQNYSAWNTLIPSSTPGLTIPYWTTTPLIYQYPFGNATIPVPQTITTPATGSGPIILAVQITIRIWDYKTNQTRQVTIVQAM